MSTAVLSESKTFTRVAEVWVPEGDHLVCASGAYGSAEAFRAASQGMRFGHGEGLPGKAWAEVRPLVLKDLDDPLFRRAAAARAEGLTCAVAVPVFAGAVLKGVLVIFCGDDAAHLGAIEVWTDQGEALRLADGYYGSASAFEAVSKGLAFAPGKGLPGTVLAAQTPVLMRDLSRAGAFLRAEAAGEIGLKNGLGVPVETPGGHHVLTLLSSEATPIARRFEIWDARPEVVGKAGGALRIDGYCESEGALWPRENPPVDAVAARAWQGPVGQALGSGVPTIHDGPTGLPKGYSLMMALPVYSGAVLTHLVAWYP